MSFDEQFLIQQLKEGNEQAYHWIFQSALRPTVHVCVGRLLHDNALAESIVDDVIYHIWEIRDHMEITTSLRSYLMRERAQPLHRPPAEPSHTHRAQHVEPRQGRHGGTFNYTDTLTSARHTHEKELEEAVACASALPNSAAPCSRQAASRENLRGHRTRDGTEREHGEVSCQERPAAAAARPRQIHNSGTRHGDGRAMTAPKPPHFRERHTDGRRTHATHIPVRTVLPHNEKKRFSEKTSYLHYPHPVFFRLH